MKMKLSWERTIIGGQTKPYDFAARDGANGVGRIYRHETSALNRGNWYWTMNAFGPGINRDGIQWSGIVATKSEEQMVETTVCLKGPGKALG